MRKRSCAWCAPSSRRSNPRPEGMPLFAPPTKVQGSFPGATVAVYLAGTTTTATIYSDNLGTLKGNPFTAQADGHWDFWTQGLVDVQFSGGGLANPFTL